MEATLLDTPIRELTPRQLMEVLRERETKRYINSIEGLAKFLGCSKRTVHQMKSEGHLDGTYSQHGKWMVFDTEKIIEKFRVTNNKRNWV